MSTVDQAGEGEGEKVRVSAYIDGFIPWEPVPERMQVWQERIHKFRISNGDIAFDIEPLGEPLGPYSYYVAKTEFPSLGKEFQLDREHAYRRIYALMTCLRLFQPGWIATRLVTVARGSIEEPVTVPIYPLPELGAQTYLWSYYPLGKGDIPSLQDFGSKVFPILMRQGVLDDPAFKVFNRGIDSMANNWTLAFIDFITCLESILSDSSPEITYRLSINTAHLFLAEKGVESRTSMFNLVKDLYKKRSTVLHTGEATSEKGGKSKKRKGIDVNDASSAQDLARHVLRTYLGYLSIGEVEGRKELRRDLERSILGAACLLKGPFYVDWRELG